MEPGTLPDLLLPRVEWRDGAPYSTDFDDVFFCRDGGIAETEYVFLAGNALPDRWSDGDSFVIGELGLGSGLNFLVTWMHFLAQAPRHMQLDYISVEAQPWSREELAKFVLPVGPLRDLQQQFIAQYPLRAPGFHRLQWGRVRLTLLFGEAEIMLGEIDDDTGPLVDAWYLDGFAPRRNPEMWTEALLTRVAELTKREGTFATYSSAGSIRRALQQAGFSVRKQPGYGTKREMCCGQLDNPVATTKAHPRRKSEPWYRRAAGIQPTSAVVIGGGLAGCAAARSLAARGIAVKLLEQKPALSTMASGNIQGAFRPDLAKHHRPREQFYMGAHQLLRSWLQSSTVPHNLDGALYLETTQRQARFDEIKKLRTVEQGWASWLDAKQASALAGFEVQRGALFYPSAGSLCPADLCRSYLDSNSNLIEIKLHSEAATLQKIDGGWRVLTTSGEELASGEAVILACAQNGNQFEQAQHLPITSTRGQVTHLPATKQSLSIKPLLNFEGYLTRAVDGQHALGATFSPGDLNTELRPEDHYANLQQLQEQLPSLAMEWQGLQNITGRAALRANVSDQFPLVGPVDDFEFSQREYQGLAHGRHWIDYPNAKVYKGLYVSLAHGSRGILSSILAAEIIADQLTNSVLPISRSVGRALLPARFTIRQLRRNL